MSTAARPVADSLIITRPDPPRAHGLAYLTLTWLLGLRTGVEEWDSCNADRGCKEGVGEALKGNKNPSCDWLIKHINEMNGHSPPTPPPTPPPPTPTRPG